MDALSAVFAVTIGLVAAAAAVFAVGYSSRNTVSDFTLPLFVLAMFCVVTAANVATFLFAWELMALSSFVLVIGDGVPRSRRQAGFLYAAMTHVATVFVAGAFFLIARDAGSQEFARMSASGEAMTRTASSVAFLFAAAGFGTKAGLVPLHIWLPRAHPVAPSHVSALMSGAMVNTGLYGIMRVSLDFLGPGEEWWGVTLIVVGSLSAVLGILYAVTEHEMKRVLAFSTIENVGIATVGIGVALTFQSHLQPALASAALVAVLLHVLSHSVLKGALFLAAGAVQRSAHTLNLDRLGGLSRRMPATAAVTLVTSLAVVGLPPFSGFPGEWLLFRSLLALGQFDSGTIAPLVGLAALGALVLTGGLALACFVRLYGIAFLGVARSPEADQAREVSLSMRLPLLALGAVAALGGVAAPLVIRIVRPAARSLFSDPGVRIEAARRFADPAGGSLSLLAVTAVFALAGVTAWLALRLILGATSDARGAIWATGMQFRPTMQYTATSFSKPLRLFFSRVLLPERRIETEFHGASPLPRLVRYSGRVPAMFEERVYHPARGFAIWSAARVRTVQNGSVQVYLLYIVATLVILLGVTR